MTRQLPGDRGAALRDPTAESFERAIESASIESVDATTKRGSKKGSAPVPQGALEGTLTASTESLATSPDHRESLGYRQEMRLPAVVLSGPEAGEGVGAEGLEELREFQENRRFSASGARSGGGGGGAASIAPSRPDWSKRGVLLATRRDGRRLSRSRDRAREQVDDRPPSPDHLCCLAWRGLSRRGRGA